MQHSGITKDKEFIPALTGIRAMCAYFIFLYHTDVFLPGLSPYLRIVINQLDTFITFFFVISGFIICYKYYETGTLNRKIIYNYSVNRFARIVPLLFILLSITFFLQYIKQLDTPTNIVKLYLYNISFVKGFSEEYILTGIGPSWTLTVDVVFYICAPLLFLYSKNILSLLKFVLLFYIIGFVLTYLFAAKTQAGFFNDYLFTAYFTFFGRAFEFMCGVYLALIVRKKFSGKFFEKIGKNTQYIGFAIVVISVLLLSLTANHYHIVKANQTWAGIFINNIMMPVGAVFLFYGMIYYKSFFQKIFASKLMVSLGDSTYSFYLLHTSFIISWIFKFISTNLLITFMCMVTFAYLFYIGIEQPLAKLIRKHFSKK